MTEEQKKIPMWEKKTSFAINTQMRSVVLELIKVTEQEIESLRRRLDKATYGG